MTNPNLRVFGFEDCTCDDRYDGEMTTTYPHSELSMGALTSPAAPISPLMITVRVGDVVDALARSVGRNLAWIDDFRDDPIVVSQDLYDVMLAFQRLRRAS